jgi:haloalkane dehalogenase
MVHGNPTWSFMWRRLIDGLEGYRRLAPDHLGMGLSSRPPAPRRLAERIGDLGAFIDSLGPIGPVHLVVHDWGGPIGLGWAARRPERVASLAIMNTGLRLPPGAKIPWRLAAFKSFRPLGRLLAETFGLFTLGLARTGTFRPLSKAAESGFLAPYRLAAHRGAVADFVEDIPLGPGHPSFEALAEAERGFARLAEKPTLLAWGLGDFVFGPAFLDDFKARAPGAAVLAMGSAGHLLLEDEPERVVAAVRAHLARATAL